MGQNTNMRSQRPNPLILVGIGAAILVLIIVLVVLLTKKSDTKEENLNYSVNLVPTNVIGNLNSFTNYILNGDSSDSRPEKRWNWASSNKLIDMTDSSADSEEREKFFEEAYSLKNQYITTLKKVYPSIKESDSDTVAAYVDNLSTIMDNNFNLLYEYHLAGWSNASDLISLELKTAANNTDDDPLTIILERYSSISGVSLASFAELYQLVKNYYSAIEAAIPAFYSYGCIKLNATDYNLESIDSCLDSASIQIKDLEALNNYHSTRTALDNYISDTIENTLSNSFDIYNITGYIK